MSFNGDLEHFPLVDIIQLLHMTNKTGILYLKSPKGESQLVFHEGFFVSANHLNSSMRIGTVLVEMHAITNEQLDEALAAQKAAAAERKPLIATLIERGTIDKDTAYKGLEKLIERTIVEVMTWSSGTFSLDVSKEYVSDEYRYFPEKLNQDILLNAQSVLMDSLRIYDERMRDGTLSTIFFNDDERTTPEPEPATAAAAKMPAITADLLGLDELDSVDRKIPDVFIGLADSNPVDDHRRVVSHALPETTVDLQDQLVAFLTSLTSRPPVDTAPPVTAIILLTNNELISHALTAVCKQENLFMFATDEEAGLDIVIEQSLGRDLHPVLLIDVPHAGDGEQQLALVRAKRSLYPHISIVLAACENTWRAISMTALGSGVRSIIPRPCRRCHDDSYVPTIMSYLSGIGSFLKSIVPVTRPEAGQQFSAAFNQLNALSEPPEIARVLLQFVALQFERAVTFVVAKTELIAEKSVGVTTAKGDGPTTPLLFRIPLEGHTILQKVVEKGRIYYGQRSDTALASVLYREIGAPRSPKILAVPLVSRGKVIALIYADFGAKPVSVPHINLIEALAMHAGSVLDNALYRKSIEKSA